MFWKAQLHVWILWGIFVFIYIVWPFLKTLMAWAEKAIGDLFPVEPDQDDVEAAARTYGEFRGKWRESAFASGAARKPFGAHSSYTPPLRPPTDRDRYLATLGLHAGASSGDIKSAYRRQAKACHPDRFAGGNHTAAARHAAGEKMARINEAYDWLCENG